jgi:hypothetical protein
MVQNSLREDMETFLEVPEPQGQEYPVGLTVSSPLAISSTKATGIFFWRRLIK